MISSSRLAELQHVPPAWKFCAVQRQERFDRENAQRADRRSRDEVEVVRGSLHGVARVLQAAQLHLQLQDAVLLPGCADGDHVLRPTRGPRRCPRRSEQQNRFRNSRERQRIEEKAFRAQRARQGGTEPGTTRFRDGRRTTGPPAPRRGPGAPTAQPRPRGPDLESAQI